MSWRVAFLLGLVAGYRVGTQHHAVTEALSVEPDEPDWLAEFASIDRTHTRSTPNGPNGYRITVGQPTVTGGN